MSTDNPVLVILDLRQVYLFVVLELVIANEACLRRVSHILAGLDKRLEVHELMRGHQFIFTSHIIVTLFLSLRNNVSHITLFYTYQAALPSPTP